MTQTHDYLADEVQTATPQKLRLMLIDGAIRFARATLAHWEDGDDDAAQEKLLRSQMVVGELVRGVRATPGECERIVDHIRRDGTLATVNRQQEVDRLVKIGRDMTAVYLIVLRDLQEAQISGDPAKMAGVIEVLEIERETARLVCEAHPAAPILDLPPSDAEISAGQAADILGAGEGQILSHHGLPTYGDTPTAGSSSMSFDA